ncbi:MAG TPA: TolC family protein [Vicinamibacterales bacterium]|nr:TolC family protein [Vicinamibacterales bacterium]
MRTRRRIITFMLGVVAFAIPARGQGTTPSPLASQYIDERAGLELNTAIARALEREPTLRAVRSDIEAARGLQQQASLRPNPTLTLERRDEPAGTDSLTSIGIQWPLDLFRRAGRVQTAERGVQATQLAVADRERLLVADVRMQYGVTAAAVRDVFVADELVAAAQQQWDVVRARVDAGGTPPLERDLLEVELRRFEAGRLLAAGRADVAVVQLKQLLGMSPSEPLLLRETLETLVVASTPEVVSEEPLSTAARPDVREAEARVTLADARVDQARREGRIDISLFGTYMRMDAGFPQQGLGAAGALERVRGQFNYVAGGAMVMLPLFNRNQGQVAAAQAERSGAEARREAAELAARAEVAAAQARDATGRRAVSLYAGGVLTLARQNLNVVRQTFDLGRATVFDVLAEQRRYLEIEQAYTSTLREAWEARAALKRALGETK